MEAINLSQEELDLLEREQQLEETMQMFRQVLERFVNDNGSEKVVEAIQTNSKLVSDLVSGMQSMTFEMKQEPAVTATMRDTHNTLILALAEIKTSNENLLEAVKEMTRATKATKEFTPKYGTFGRIESIEVTIKN